MTTTEASDRASEPNPYTPPGTPPAKSRWPSRTVPTRPKSGVQIAIAVACCLLILFCTLWFFAAVYELIRFTVLQDAYGPHTPAFRAAYAKSAATAFLLGVPAAIVLFRSRFHYVRDAERA